MAPFSSPTRDKLMNPAVLTPHAFSTYGVIHAPSNSPEVLMSLLRFSAIFFAPSEVLIVPISLMVALFINRGVFVTFTKEWRAQEEGVFNCLNILDCRKLDC